MTADREGFDLFVDQRQRALLRSAWLRWERIRRRDDPEIYVRRVLLSTWVNWSRRRWRAERPGNELPSASRSER